MLSSLPWTFQFMADCPSLYYISPQLDEFGGSMESRSLAAEIVTQQFWWERLGPPIDLSPEVRLVSVRLLLDCAYDRKTKIPVWLSQNLFAQSVVIFVPTRLWSHSEFTILFAAELQQ